MVHVLDYEDCEAHELTTHIHYSVHCCRFKNMRHHKKVVTIYLSETDIPQILFQVTFLICYISLTHSVQCHHYINTLFTWHT